MVNSNNPFSIAPMLDWTDRHFRYLCRLITSDTLLYTEMVTCKSLLNANNAIERYLKFDKIEHPIALQLGGSKISEFVACAKLALKQGFDEININVGCPSDRVQSGEFGACLMAQPELIAEAVDAMSNEVEIPITIKCRTGIDDLDSYSFLRNFINTVRQAGCKKFIVHARKAWLTGLSPKQNRDIPALDYERVYQIKKDFPFLDIHINGGIRTVKDIQCKLHYVDGVMVGRAVYQNPWLLKDVDKLVYHKDQKLNNQFELIETYIPYIKMQLKQGVKLHAITMHMLGLFHGLAGAKKWRRTLSEKANVVRNDKEAISLIFEALTHVS